MHAPGRVHDFVLIFSLVRFSTGRGLYRAQGISAVAKSYFDLSRELIEKLECIKKDELFEFINLIEKRTY